MVYGFWGQNIGNAFFNVGGQWLLQEVFGKGSVGLLQDQPGYRTFHDQSEGNPASSFPLLSTVDARVLVLQGPMLTTTFSTLWAPTFRALAERGTKIVLLGGALFRYTREEIEAAKRAIDEFNVTALVTRDADTFQALQHDVEYAYNGIDSAFFVPDAVELPALEIEDFYTFAFDRYPEPFMRIGPSRRSEGSFRFDGVDWAWRQPRLQKWLSHRGKAVAYLGHALDRRKLPPRMNDHLVLRPEHRTNPHITWKIYRHPNSIASDEPFTYFALYGRTQLTLSDRVHACVATLAYGNPAMLFSPSPRARLFERLGLDTIREQPVQVPREVLHAEKAAELAFLREHRDALLG